MRKISANYIFPITSEPIKNGVVVIDDLGKIIDIINYNGNLTEISNCEFYNGIIVPGFVNSHCHLELSSQINRIPPKIGLVNFLKEISRFKKSAEFNSEDFICADKYMYNNGINIVGDISNFALTSEVKSKSKITYHTFVELIGLSDSNSVDVFEKGTKIYNQFSGKKSIVPHAPYTISRKLFNLISDFAIKNYNVISIHNQESASENEMFINGFGDMFDFVNFFENNFNEYLPTSKTSLQSYLTLLNKDINILLVHNIFTEENDIDFANKYSENIYWCFCPLSNLYIENKLPQVDLFYKKNQKIVLGTDSLSSNQSLDILEEMKVIQDNFTNIPFSEILKWATINGARALKLDDNFGSLEIGKTPGIVLIENFDFDNQKLKTKSKIKRLG